MDLHAPTVTHYEGPKGNLLWSQPDCYDCSGCIAICPFDALRIDAGIVTADMQKCTLCTLCERVCPTEALAVVRAPREER